MRSPRIILIVAVVLGLVPAAHAVPTVFVVPLDGAQEAPGPGDPDGAGTAWLSIDPGLLTIDWNISVANIDLPLTGAHIHQAPAGVPGPVVVNLSAQLSGTGLFSPALADVLANPTDYYVNVHNTVYPAGAIRGQLGAPVVPVPSALGLVACGLVSLRLRGRKLA